MTQLPKYLSIKQQFFMCVPKYLTIAQFLPNLCLTLPAGMFVTFSAQTNILEISIYFQF